MMLCLGLLPSLNKYLETPHESSQICATKVCKIMARTLGLNSADSQANFQWASEDKQEVEAQLFPQPHKGKETEL